MAEILLALQGLIITVRKNGLATLWMTLMIIVLIVVWSARGNFASFLQNNPSPEVQKERFTQSVIVGGLINDKIGEVRQQINADRILIRQFQGQKTVAGAGMPFSSSQIIFSSMAPGVSLDPSSLTPLPLSALNDQLTEMWRGTPHCISYTADQVKNPDLLKILHNNGVSIIYSCPIIDLEGQPIGTIGAGYLTREKKRPTDEEINKILGDTAEKIAGYIVGINQVKSDPWYVKLFREFE